MYLLHEFLTHFRPSYRINDHLYFDDRPVNTHAMIVQHLGVDLKAKSDLWLTCSQLVEYVHDDPHLCSTFHQGLHQRFTLSQHQAPTPTLRYLFGTPQQITCYLEERPVGITLHTLLERQQAGDVNPVMSRDLMIRLVLTCTLEMARLWSIADQHQIKIALDLRQIMITEQGVLFFTPHYAIEEMRQAVGAMAVLSTDQWLDYVSPEELSNQASPMHLSAIFSASMIMYTLLYGHNPLTTPGEKGNVMNRLYLMLKQGLPHPKSLCPHLPIALQDFIAKGVSSKPQDRFATWSAYHHALTQIAQDIPPLSRHELKNLYTIVNPVKAPSFHASAFQNLPCKDLIEHQITQLS